jgi:phosphopantothenoylcysteine decarboxylase / phosphopantothenate---cysteine ligase
MSLILITSGPTRQYLDPVRYLSNGSSGRMGAALAAAVVDAGHRTIVVTGPVDADAKYPSGVEVLPVVSTEDMLAACQKIFPDCDGLIAAAAPCDYRPAAVSECKIRKTGEVLRLELVETPDIVATLAAGKKPSQWLVAFALETEDQHLRAMQKLERKNCDLIVVNGPATINSAATSVEVLDREGRPAGAFSGKKDDVAREILKVIERRLIVRT